MPVLFCPRCQRANPERRLFAISTAPNCARVRMVRSIGWHGNLCFPRAVAARHSTISPAVAATSGRRRDLLRQGTFAQFFGGLGRTDLAKAAQEAAANNRMRTSRSRFLDALPVMQTQAPKIDINPRRLHLRLICSRGNNDKFNYHHQPGPRHSPGHLDGHGGQCLAETRRGQSEAVRDRHAARTIAGDTAVDTRHLPAGGTFGAQAYRHHQRRRGRSDGAAWTWSPTRSRSSLSRVPDAARNGGTNA